MIASIAVVSTSREASFVLRADARREGGGRAGGGRFAHDVLRVHAIGVVGPLELGLLPTATPWSRSPPVSTTSKGRDGCVMHDTVIQTAQI